MSIAPTTLQALFAHTWQQPTGAAGAAPAAGGFACEECQVTLPRRSSTGQEAAWTDQYNGVCAARAVPTRTADDWATAIRLAVELAPERLTPLLAALPAAVRAGLAETALPAFLTTANIPSPVRLAIRIAIPELGAETPPPRWRGRR